MYFFPVQLFFIHLQRNSILLLFWLLVLAYLTGMLGKEYGLPYLFINPEYLGDVNVWSYAVMGFAYGTFIMAFNISSYIINSARFPFLATLNRPFMKYCLNNSVIPLIITVVYIIRIFNVLYYGEYQALATVLIFISVFLLGMFLFIVLSLSYFFTFNKDLYRLFNIKPEAESIIVYEKNETKASSVQQEGEGSAFRRLRKKFRLTDEWRVDTYLKNPFRISRCRPTSHYERSLLMEVFQQNHINAAVFEVVIFIALIVLGLFREVKIFQIPAGASILLLFTMLLMLASAIHFILRRWSTLFFIGGFVLLNYISTFESFSVHNYAYGLNYRDPIIYNPDSIYSDLVRSAPFQSDLLYHEKILDNWKKRVQEKYPSRRKPYIVMISCSGGGSKAALWTFYSLQKLDSATNGRMLDQAFLISGSSGGMIGAAYIRELYYMKQKGVIPGFYSDSLADNIAKDLLNPVAASLALNDMFIRMQTFTEGNYIYPKDRAYAFEKQLNENTGYVLDRRLVDYREPEKEGLIPLMIFSPTIINDSKRLLISPHPLSFMCYNSVEDKSLYSVYVEDIEFIRLFEKQNALNLKFTTAIRMNATFPYILPAVSLPSKPSMQIMDAGMRDNYGIRTAVKYIFNLKDWINKNTSGVILVKVHDSRPLNYNTGYIRSLLDNLLSPFGTMVNNMSHVHQQENDLLLQYADEWLGGKLKVIELRLSRSIKDQEISMSLHLTKREKEKIRNAINSPGNQVAVEQVKLLLK